LAEANGRIEGFRRERGQARQPLDLSNGGVAVVGQSRVPPGLAEHLDLWQIPAVC